jgi:hypothetical protein
MDQRKKRASLVAFVGTLLLLAALASMASSTWATPEQRVRANDDTIPDKYCDPTWLMPGESTEIRIVVTNPDSALDTWYTTLVTDAVDSNLRIAGVWSSQGYASWTDGDVTFDIGTMTPGTEVTLRLYVEVNDDATPCHDVYNTAYLTHVGWGPVLSENSWMFRIACERYVPLSIKHY